MQNVNIGEIVDYPLDKFKEEVVNSKLPVGVIHGYTAFLSAIYNNLNRRKDGIIDLVNKGNEVDNISLLLRQIYSEMQKIEDKVVFLREREEELKKL